MTHRRRALRATSGAVGVVVAALAAALIGALAAGKSDDLPARRQAFARPYDGRLITDELEALIVQSDGQAFATLARDPTLSRTSEEFSTPEEGAYRAQRPLLPWLAWAGSLGRPGWVPPALAALFVLAAGAAAAVAAELLADTGRSPWIAVGVLLLPGMYAALEYFGPEALGLALALAGILRARRHGPAEPWALAAFAVAGLARETMLLVPFALGLHAVSHRRFRAAAALASTALPFLVWLAVVRVRVGAWALGSSLSGRMSVRMDGLSDVLAGRSEAPDGDRFFLAVTVVLVVAAVVLRPRSELTAIAAVVTAFSLFLGPRVWAWWVFFGRVLLPAHVAAVLALLSPRAGGGTAAPPPRPGATGAPSDRRATPPGPA